MPTYTIELPEDLWRAAKDAELPLNYIVRRALEQAVLERAGASVRSEKGGTHLRVVATNDVSSIYQEGYDFGQRWAWKAPRAEVADIAKWSGQHWLKFRVHPELNTLPRAYCEEHGMAEPNVRREFWFEKSTYTQGMIDGVAAVHSRLDAHF